MELSIHLHHDEQCPTTHAHIHKHADTYSTYTAAFSQDPGKDIQVKV